MPRNRLRTRIRLLPYAQHSASARAVARAAGALVLRTEGSAFRPRTTDVVVNWGSRLAMPFAKVYNDPRNVEIARDKRHTLELLHTNGVPAVEYTVDIAEAQRWLDEGYTVVQRNTATGQGGTGIILLNPTLTVNVRATGDGVLWTKYFKRKHEYRVHVWGDEVLDVQLKRKRRESDVNTSIRSYSNGWVFCRDGISAPARVISAAVGAVRCLGLDFGAVDVGDNLRLEEARVFEVNTAPGVEGATVEKYANKIKELVA